MDKKVIELKDSEFEVKDATNQVVETYKPMSTSKIVYHSSKVILANTFIRLFNK